MGGSMVDSKGLRVQNQGSDSKDQGGWADVAHPKPKTGNGWVCGLTAFQLPVVSLEQATAKPTTEILASPE
jgi:hypothetical protein